MFFKIGLFTFGGGYAMIPVMEKELVDRHKWLKKEDFIDCISLTQAVPGPVAFNMSIYLGYEVKGFWGALVSVIGVALPSVLIIVTIAAFFTNFTQYKVVQSMFRGIRPAVVALIAYAAINIAGHLKWTWSMVVIAIVSFLLNSLLGLNPIFLIIFAFILATVVFLMKRKTPKDDQN
jgi:chromate transporter